MTNKAAAILPYLTIIGWIIGFFLHKNKPSNLSNVHLKNGLGLHGISFLMNVLSLLLKAGFMITLGFYVNIAVLVLSVFGVVYAVQEREKAVPIVGDWFQAKIPNF